MDEQWTEDFYAALREEVATAATKWQTTPRVVIRSAANMLTCVGNAVRAADSKRNAKS